MAKEVVDRMDNTGKMAKVPVETEEVLDKMDKMDKMVKMDLVAKEVPEETEEEALVEEEVVAEEEVVEAVDANFTFLPNNKIPEEPQLTLAWL